MTISDKIPARLKSIVGSSTAASLTVLKINTIFFGKLIVKTSQLSINLLVITLAPGSSSKKHPAVTHIPFFQTAQGMTSRWCDFA